MSFYKASKKAEDLKQGGSNHITSSGIYPVTILAPLVSVSKNGSTTVDMYLEYNGQKQVIYGNLRITNNDGSVNKIGNKIFNQLVIIAGIDDDVSDPVEHELPIGKKEAMKTAAVLEDLADIECLMRIQMEYGIYNGNITEKKVIKAFFRKDKATAEEIVNETAIGAGYERELKYINHITYNDGVTPEQVTTWIASNRPEGTGSAEPTTKAPSFGKKRAFGQKADEE